MYEPGRDLGFYDYETNGTAKLRVYAENPLKLPLSFETKVNYGFGDQQGYAGTQTITGTNDFKGLLHSKYEFAKYYTQTAGVNDVPTYTLTDNTVNREGKIIHEWDIKQEVNGFNGQDGLKIDIDIVPLTSYSKPYGTSNGSPQFKSGTAFYMGGDCYKEDKRMTLRYTSGYYIGPFSIYRPNVIYNDPYEYYAYADHTQAAFRHYFQGTGLNKNWGENNINLSLAPTGFNSRNPYAESIKSGYTFLNRTYSSHTQGSTAETKAITGEDTPDISHTVGDYYRAYSNTTVNADYSWEQYKKCPFYIINGGMVIDGFLYRNDSQRSPSLQVNGYQGSIGWLAFYYEPGRDLGVFRYDAEYPTCWGEDLMFTIWQAGQITFPGIAKQMSAKNAIFFSREIDYRNGPHGRAAINWAEGKGDLDVPIKVYSNIPLFGIWTSCYKDGLFEQDATIWSGHNYSVRMKINGCTNWPGATNTIGGFRYFDD